MFGATGDDEKVFGCAELTVEFGSNAEVETLFDGAVVKSEFEIGALVEN